MTGLRRSLRHPATRAVLVSILVLASIVGSHYARIKATHNFEEVVPGEIYRSSQIHGGDLQKFQKSHGIKAVLNLRGENKGRSWYETEVKDAKEAGIDHIDFKMKASRQLTKQQAKEVLELVEKAPKPLLIHCQGGADRSGLVSALVLASRGESTEEVHEQLSFTYGHLPTNGTDAMCVSLRMLLPIVSELDG